MASNDIRKFTWYPQYIVQPQDMSGLEQYLRATTEASIEGLCGAAVLSGMRVSTVGGMDIEVEAGIAASPDGRLMILDAADQVTLASDPSQARRSLIVARPKLTDVDSIIEPTNPPNVVTFTQRLDMELVVIPGTPAGTPVYPAKEATDTVLLGVLIPAGASSLSITDFEFGPRETVKPTPSRLRELSSGDYTMPSDGTEEIFEMDATSASGQLILPPVSLMVGRKVTLVKTDSSVNTARLKPDGSDTISGQTEVDLDTQWQSVTIYGSKTAWRMI